MLSNVNVVELLNFIVIIIFALEPILVFRIVWVSDFFKKYLKL
jgi:hypothetical protein